jgi:hypothetical protein
VRCLYIPQRGLVLDTEMLQALCVCYNWAKQSVFELPSIALRWFFFWYLIKFEMDNQGLNFWKPTCWCSIHKNRPTFFERSVKLINDFNRLQRLIFFYAWPLQYTVSGSILHCLQKSMWTENLWNKLHRHTSCFLSM